MTQREGPMIRLDQLLKLSGKADTGGQAKMRIQEGQVKVNGTVETRRGRKLYVGDQVNVDGETIAIDEALLAREGTQEPEKEG